MRQLPLKTLEDASRSDTEDYVLVHSQRTAVCFDDVAREYNKGLSASRHTPCSIDAIYLDNDDGCAFVEFKNKRLDCRLPYEVRRKALESLLILGDICGLRLRNTRKEADFILVYSSAKTADASLPDDETPPRVSDSPAFDGIATTVGNYAGKHYIPKGLGTLCGVFFRDVFVFTEKEFDDYIRKTSGSYFDAA